MSFEIKTKIDLNDDVLEKLFAKIVYVEPPLRIIDEVSGKYGTNNLEIDLNNLEDKIEFKYTLKDEITLKQNLEDIKKSINMIMRSNIGYEFRTTVVPTILKKEDIDDMTSVIKNAKKYALQQFEPKNALDPALRKISPYTGEEILEMAQLAKKNVKTVVIRGIAQTQTL